MDRLMDTGKRLSFLALSQRMFLEVNLLSKLCPKKALDFIDLSTFIDLFWELPQFLNETADIRKEEELEC
jgi:hypothetical protein